MFVKEHDVLFIHIPRTGGMSVRRALSQALKPRCNALSHGTARAASRRKPEIQGSTNLPAAELVNTFITEIQPLMRWTRHALRILPSSWVLQLTRLASGLLHERNEPLTTCSDVYRSLRWYYEYEPQVAHPNTFMFTVVRHPFTRLVSLYNYAFRDGGMTFHDMLNFLAAIQQGSQTQRERHQFLQSQVSFLVDSSGTIPKHMCILRFETLERDFKSKVVPEIQQRRNSKAHVDLVDLVQLDSSAVINEAYFADSQVSLLAYQLCEEDFRVLGYDVPDNIAHPYRTRKNAEENKSDVEMHGAEDRLEGERFPSPDMRCTLELRSVGVRCRKLQVLQNVNATLRSGETVLLLGESGGGKTTLLSVLSGSAEATEGSVHLSFTLNYKGSTMRKQIGDHLGLRAYSSIVLQNNAMVDNFSSVEQVAFCMLLRHPTARWRNVHSLAVLTLQALGLRSCLDKRVSWLSGGERKRVAIASDMAGLEQSKAMLLFDEPVSGLDESTAASVLSYLLQDRFTKDRLFVLSMHKPSPENIVRFQRVVVMSRGTIKMDTSSEEFLSLSQKKIASPFSTLLIESQSRLSHQGLEESVDEDGDTVALYKSQQIYERLWLECLDDAVPGQKYGLSVIRIWFILVRRQIRFLRNKWKETFMQAFAYILIGTIVGLIGYRMTDIHSTTERQATVSAMCKTASFLLASMSMGVAFFPFRFYTLTRQEVCKGCYTIVSVLSAQVVTQLALMSLLQTLCYCVPVLLLFNVRITFQLFSLCYIATVAFAALPFCLAMLASKLGQMAIIFTILPLLYFIFASTQSGVVTPKWHQEASSYLHINAFADMFTCEALAHDDSPAQANACIWASSKLHILLAYLCFIPLAFGVAVIRSRGQLENNRLTNLLM